MSRPNAFRPATIRLRRLGPAAVLFWLAVAGAAGQPVRGAGVTTTFGTPTATSTFGQGIEFLQPVSLSGAVLRSEIVLEFPGEAGAEVLEAQPSAGGGTLRYLLNTSTGGLQPNTIIVARWRIVGADGVAGIGPAVTVRYDDTRFAWQTRQGSIVRVHWYEGPDAFGSRALQIGEAAIERSGALLGVSEVRPVDFFIYAAQQPFYDALGPGTRENVGGQANAAIRTLFALITPAEINDAWVGIVIPHELTHLVFDSAVSNPYHFPPRWLNEGLAVYQAQGYGSSDRAAVEGAARDGSLMPLPALSGQFPTTRARFDLAYAESVAAVDYLVQARGEAALVRLIRSYAQGVTDDEAFSAALGMSVQAFDAAWRASLSAREPVAYGPQAAPGGPLPADWSGAAASPGSGAGTDQPAVSAGASGAAAGGASPADAATAGRGAVATGGDVTPVLLIGAGGLVLVAVGAATLAARRRRRDAA